jgi:hypothetical protein
MPLHLWEGPMSNVVRKKRGRADVAPTVAVMDDREIRDLAMKYDLRIAQVRGLVALYGDNKSKIVAAAKRLTAIE